MNSPKVVICRVGDASLPSNGADRADLVDAEASRPYTSGDCGIPHSFHSAGSRELAVDRLPEAGVSLEVVLLENATSALGSSAGRGARTATTTTSSYGPVLVAANSARDCSDETST